ncbi:hypothetical protein EC957_009261 [Mortierella hygrophila]|uniref:Uncharacterized protein n=1 Tax=Mortierella hygrophila TaxID=979708 RepID=A0A9P6K8J6_9FUNG|nr:hypothetical protein EC957_009261 [Mortierella hygrophila]
MGAKNKKAKQLKEARDKKKRKQDDKTESTCSANIERQASEEACTSETGTDENGCEDVLDKGWEYIFEEEDSKFPSEDDDTNEDWDMLYGVLESEINDIQENLVSMVDKIGRYVRARTKDGSLTFLRGRKVGYYKRIIARSRNWEKHRGYVESGRGKHPKTKNLMAEYDLHSVLRDWIIKTKQRCGRNPTKLQYHINKNVLPGLDVDRKIA